MCQLLYYSKNAKSRPLEEHIENSYFSNSDGCGVAWPENGYLRYEKGFDLKQAQVFAATLPPGFCMHFRLSSAGGKSENLIHPFPVRKDVPLKQRGRSNKLLFHNGHLSGYKELLLNHLSPRILMLQGDISDTRVIALIVSIHGVAFLKKINEGSSFAGKFALMTPARTTLIGKFDEEDGCFYSNSCYKYGWGTYHKARGEWDSSTGCRVIRGGVPDLADENMGHPYGMMGYD